MVNNLHPSLRKRGLREPLEELRRRHRKKSFCELWVWVEARWTLHWRWFYQNSAGHQTETLKGFHKSQLLHLIAALFRPLLIQSIWHSQSIMLSCVTWLRDWKVAHINNLWVLFHICILLFKVKYGLKLLLSVSVQFLLRHWLTNRWPLG